MSIKRIWDQIDEMKRATENISVADLQAEQAADPDLLVVDIRELQERLLTGAVPGAVHVPRGMLEFWADPTLGYFRDCFRPGRRTVLYCAGGGRSVLAARSLTEMGYTNVAQLEVGFDGWQRAGGEVEDVAAESKWVRRASGSDTALSDADGRRVGPAVIEVLPPPALTPLVWLDRAAVIFADRVAVIDGARSWTWREFAHRCRAGARVLADYGVVARDRVGVLAPNSTLVLESQYAIPAAQAIIVNLNPRLSAAEIAYIIDHSQMRVLLVDDEHEEQAHEAVRLSAAGPDAVRVVASSAYDAALPAAPPMHTEITDELTPISINYTSGTTGTPKGVVVTHRSVYLQALAMSLHLRLGLDAVYLWTLPMFHANGWAFVWAVSAVGCPSVILRRPSPEAVFEAVVAFEVTHLCAAPTVLNSLVSHGADELPWPPLTVAVGGSPPSPALIARTRRAGWSVVHLYGLTETGGPAVICLPLPEWSLLDDDQLAAAMARQGVPNVVTTGVATADPSGRLLPIGASEAAEIVVQGQSVFAGYLRDPETTSATLHGRWLRTGDVGRTDSEGYVHLLDRQKDIIISGGENISSVEVERLLDQHPSVLESAVVAVPDEHWGEVPVAVVTLREPDGNVDELALAAALIEHVKGRAARFKAPRRVVFGPLPKGETGKVLKHELRASLRDTKQEAIDR